ncbi:hypothetical protein DLM_4235 [Aquitalea magnusonii]|jgi:uncharacterized protein (DUF2252 family)|uniref:DUF2252 domain-containing protein n=1 Tax=Aquitalea magnusonii TaxID=332411 RepID=A0A3G9GVS9_9NEIS|nr:DUF2252 domain-containing protein [Aquitalea magnusonii]BBF87807.1 hypothetical protein DLM_4235 [Aquitalea magnusonii]
MPSIAHQQYEERLAAGRARREQCPRTRQADCVLHPQRDVVSMLRQTSAGRVPGLVPLRYQRMQASPFTFFRGMAMIQAADLACGPSSGMRLQLCGDAHLMNYGFFASPERQLMFDINDFDETHHGPWEWDVKRLAVSVVLAAREHGFSDEVAARAVCQLVGTYRRRMQDYARISQLELWYSKVGFEQLLTRAPNDSIRQQLLKLADKARGQTQEKLLPKMTVLDNGNLRLRDDPPVIFHMQQQDQVWGNDEHWLGDDQYQELLQPMLARYSHTLKEDRRTLLERFRLVDAAFKVVGVGSVGTRCLVMLLQDSYDQPLFLQLKEARNSVLEPYTQQCIHGHQGKRVVFGQRLMQAASDLFLGWTTGPGDRHFYVRQLRDMKAAPSLESFGNNESLIAFGQACAWALARAHAKSSGQAAELAGYIGQSDKFDQAIASYALAYADQVKRDFSVFTAALAKHEL